MKVRNEYYRVGKDIKGQEFTRYTDIWEWSDEECKPVIVGQQDDQARVQSSESVALAKVFDKFLPEEMKEIFGVKVDYTNEIVDSPAHLDLSELGDIMAQADDFRERYGLADDMPIGKVFETVQRRCLEDLKKNGNVIKPAPVAGAKLGEPDSSADVGLNGTPNESEPSDKDII